MFACKITGNRNLSQLKFNSKEIYSPPHCYCLIVYCFENVVPIVTLKSGPRPTQAHKVELEKIQLVYSISFCSVKAAKVSFRFKNIIIPCLN